jgi:hypothetical protein
MSNTSAIAACLVQCPFLGEPAGAPNYGVWAQSGHCVLTLSEGAFREWAIIYHAGSMSAAVRPWFKAFSITTVEIYM